MQKVVLATGNAGKVRELASLLNDFGLDVVAQTDLGVESAEETGLTFIENAILKARHAAQNGPGRAGRHRGAQGLWPGHRAQGQACGRRPDRGDQL